MALFQLEQTEAIEMMRPVRAEDCEQFRREDHPFCFQFLERLRDGMTVVENNQVGDQVIVFDGLELVVADVFGLPSLKDEQGRPDGRFSLQMTTGIGTLPVGIAYGQLFASGSVVIALVAATWFVDRPST